MAASDPERNDASLIEHYRQANSDLKLSDLALLIHVRATGSWTRQSAVSAIDNELQEVRDVLAEVIREHDDPMSEYGCTTHTTLRARSLFQQLQVKE
jgi:hypothetical protein